MTIKSAFGAVRADEGLKSRTMAYIKQSKRRSRVFPAVFIPAACAVIAALFVIGAKTYYTPFLYISIDINPSLELGVNRFDRVISVEGWGDEGKALASGFRVSNMNYSEALDMILESGEITGYVSAEDSISVSVITLEEGGRSEEMLKNIERVTSEKSGVECGRSDYEGVCGAHESGLSYGKYRAYIAALEQDPDLTPEEAGGMTMRELHSIAECGGGHQDDQQSDQHGDHENEHGSGQYGQGSGQNSGQNGQGGGSSGGNGGHHGSGHHGKD